MRLYGLLHDVALPVPLKVSKDYLAAFAWRSTLGNVIPLDASLDIEAVALIGSVRHVDRSVSPLSGSPPVAACYSPYYFVLRMWTGGFSYRVDTVQALLRALPLSGLALSRFLVDAELITPELLENFRRAQRQRVSVFARTPFVYELDLSKLPAACRSQVSDVVWSFMQLRDKDLLLRGLASVCRRHCSIRLILM